MSSDQSPASGGLSGSGLPAAPKFLAIFPSIMLPMFLAVVDQTIVATALPAIAATMCSIPVLEGALQEIRRILKPGGRLLFVEHGRAPEPRVRWFQDHLTPVWKRFAGGCHLNRAIEDMVGHAGFRIEHLDKGYMRGPKAMTFMYEGSARPE